MSEDCMLTTIDNPYDPFEQFTLWLMFDKEQGYNTCEYLARVAELSEDMSEKERNEAIDKAMEFIIDNDFLCIYKKTWGKQDTPEE